MSRYATIVSPKVTPQTQPIPGKAMVPNSAGGFTFQLDDWKRLDRFLILGSEGGSYYVGEHEAVIDNAQSVSRCIAEDGIRTVGRIVEISDKGRAPKNDPAIFALSMCIASTEKATRDAALVAIPKVCRIGTHLFQLMGCLKKMVRWNRSLRRAVSEWYTKRDAGNLASQIVKYQNRNGFTHRDVLRIAHPRSEGVTKSILTYAAGKTADGELPSLIVAHEKAKTASEAEVCGLIREHNLTRESIPTEHLNSPKVWGALLEQMPLTAMIRNLGNMSKCGLLAPMSDAASAVAGRLGDAEQLRKSRVHPLAVLLAMKTYANGKGVRGSGEWVVVPQITDALDAAFYKAFDFVEPTGKRFLLGIDVSGSMSSPISATPILSCAEGAAAIAMTIAKTEAKYYAHGFAGDFVDLGITPRMRLDDILSRTRAMNFGTTDCALPMRFALTNQIQVDAFVVLTDCETYAGSIHPSQALAEYRAKMGIPARLIVIGMTASGFTIADPNDAGMLDIAGFDAAIPTILSEFVRE